MNTVTAMTQANSLEQDESVNPEQKQFTAPEVNQKHQWYFICFSIRYSYFNEKRK